MTDVLIHRHEAVCYITGNYPVREILDQTSTRDRGLADYQKELRGWLTSVQEIDLMKQIRAHGQKKIKQIKFEGADLTVEEAKSKLGAKAQQGLISVLMASDKDMPRALAGCLDDSFSVFDHLTGCFPNGILPEVESILRASSVDFKVVDKRIRPKQLFQDWALDSKWATLRPPQEYLFNRLKRDEHGAIEWSVGSGKTLGLVLTIVHHKVKTLYVVPGIDLMQQTASKIMEYTNIPPDQIGMACGSRWNLQPITVVTADTFESRLAEFKAFGFDQLVVDEAHYAGAKGLYKAINEMPCFFRYFASGTLYREDHPQRRPGHLDMVGENMLLKAVCLKTLDYRGYRDGVAAGYLSKVAVECIREVPKLDGCGYKVARDRGIINNAYRNQAFLEMVKKHTDQGKTALALVVETEHAANFHETALAMGIKAEMITGATPMRVRESIINDLRLRRVSLVTGTSCVRTGMDVVTLDVVANVGGMKSYRATVQGSGRATREGSLVDEEGGFISYVKNGATIIDSMDSHHGMLQDHALERMKAYDKEGFEVPHLKEWFEEERIQREQKTKRAMRVVHNARLARVAKLPHLKKELSNIEALLLDPDRQTAYSTPQLKNFRDRLHNEIKSIETEAARTAIVGVEDQ